VQTLLCTAGYEELLVIDQSDGEATEEAVAAFADPRLRYLRTPTRGVTIARNIGIAESKAEIVAYTDDDCRVTEEWAINIAAIFDADPEVAVVCGRVRIPDELQGSGYTLGFEPQVREWQARFPPLDSDWGISANMALRKSILGRVGVFDPMLGAGAPLRSGGEPDLIFRVLRAGLKVVNAHEVVVDHYGTRSFGSEAQKLVRGYGAGTAAALFKHVRLGDPVARSVYAGFLGTTIRRVSTNLVRGRRPLGLGYLGAFLGGSLQSFKYGVDRNSRQYVQRV
jgi:glycosyltransferase involved in cell wall biosynthesis